MPVGPGRNLLATRRIQRISNALADIRTLPQQLLFLNRTPLVDAVDEEITARWDGRVVMADIIADDQQAVVRSDGQFTLESAKIPNIKHGAPLNQAMINLLDRINRGGGLPEDGGVITNHVTWRLGRLIQGVRQRMESMIVGMALDSFAYNRLGVNFTMTFGIPSALKVTPGTAWSTAATATPIADIQSLRQVAADTYGKAYNRITMSTTAFQQLIATTEFRNKSSGMLQFVFDANTFDTSDQTLMKGVVSRVLDGMIVELYDAQPTLEDSSGVRSTTRFLPVNKVILSSTADDNGQAYDFANAIVSESTAATEAGGLIEGFSGPTRGPVGFVTLASHDLNPPGVNLWAVARGAPRLFDQAAFANLTVG